MIKVRGRVRSRRGMTALQAAILTGISIAVALMVGYWIWTVVVGSVRSENLQLSLPYAKYNGTHWTITLKVSNNGPSDSTIVDVRINGVPYEEWNNNFGTGNAVLDLNAATTDLDTPSYLLASGDEITVKIILSNAEFKSGETIEIAFVTAANQVYTSSVSLP